MLTRAANTDEFFTHGPKPNLLDNTLESKATNTGGRELAMNRDEAVPGPLVEVKTYA